MMKSKMKILENELLTIKGKENLSYVQLYGVLPLRPSYDIDRCIKQIEINLSEYIKPEVESKITYLKWCSIYYLEKLSLYTSPFAAPMVEHEHVYIKELIEWIEAKIKVLSKAKPAKKSDKLSTSKSKRLKELLPEPFAEIRNIDGVGDYWDKVECVCSELGRSKCDLNCKEYEKND